MNVHYDPLKKYQASISRYEEQARLLQQKINRIAWLRFAVFAITLLAVYLSWQSSAWIVFTIAITGTTVFVRLVSIYTDNKEILNRTKHLIALNSEEMELLKGNYHQREDGKQLEPAHHAYAQDLDIFGPASIYQYIQRCTAEQSKARLAAALLNGATKEQIALQQTAIQELMPELEWRQAFQSAGMEHPITTSTEQKIDTWIQQSPQFDSKYYRWLILVYPAFSVVFVGLYLANFIPANYFYLLVFLQFIFAFSLSKKIHSTYTLLSKIVPQVNTIQQQLLLFELKEWHSPRIIQIRNSIQSSQTENANKEISELKKILDRFDVRLNILAFYFLNTFLLWDLRQILSLNKWKKSNQQSVRHWFAAIAEIEFLSSLATLSFNQPKWCYPQIVTTHFTLQGNDIGHPLIPEYKRINNNFTTEGVSTISLITGSNMGGKSTFLRSIGVNTILALMGSPVCASSFKISPVRLLSSMRISDNLAENTSTFYAELKKLQTIIEAVNAKQKIFILLDEILRGTNSLDRHTGSKALIKQLIEKEAVAIIATHDVELAKLEKDYPKSIRNYHFDVQVEKEELYFDYKLKQGICQSLNASILMKKIGIDIS